MQKTELEIWNEKRQEDLLNMVLKDDRLSAAEKASALLVHRQSLATHKQADATITQGKNLVILTVMLMIATVTQAYAAIKANSSESDETAHVVTCENKAPQNQGSIPTADPKASEGTP